MDSQSLQQFVSDRPWGEKQLWSAIRREVIPSLEPIESWGVDETGWVKQGDHSVGVSHQYCGAAGKTRRTRLAWVEIYLAHGLRETAGELEKVWLVRSTGFCCGGGNKFEGVRDDTT